MRRFIILIFSMLLLAMGWQRAQGFALLGPLSSTGGLPAGDGDVFWQVPTIGYDLPGDDGTPKNIGGSFIGQGYRWNLPVMYYAYNEGFSGFFGLQGEQAIDSAFAILNNSFTNNAGLGLDGYSSNLMEFPFDSQSFNYTAESLGLTDIKSDVLYLMMEELGLAEPERWAWTLHDRFLPSFPGAKCPVDELYLVVQRNFADTPSPLTQVQYSPYINDTLYTYDILEACTGPNPLAQTEPIAVDPYANSFTAVAGLGDGLGTVDPTAPDGFQWDSIEVGGFYTGLTVDDVAGLRYLLSTNQIVMEDSAAGSFLEQTNFTPSPLTTQNLGALLQFAQTNPPAALLTEFPNLVIDSVSNYYTLVTNPIVFSYFTNFTGSPVGSPPVFVIGTNGYILSFQTNFAYTFGNVVIVDYNSNTPAQLVTISLGPPPTGSPVGTPFTTNVSIQNITLTNFSSGDYFLLPPGSCGFDIVATNGSNIIPVTNSVITATNTTTVNTANTGFVGTQSVVYNFTQRLFLYDSCTLVTNGPAQYQGIGHIQFVRVPDENLDSLTGNFLQPITNTYSMVWFNPLTSQLGTRIFQRIVTSPDVMLDGFDYAAPNPPVLPPGDALSARSIPNWDLANIIPKLAGPGTINPPVVITLNTVGNVYGNGSLDDNFLSTNSILSQATQGGLLAWASFDATTNPPIVYPNGTSIQNLENQLVVSVSPTSLPNGTNGVAYPPTTFTATGGQPPYTWSLGGTQLPSGLAFFGGVLSGTPFNNSPGIYDFTIQLTDSIGRVVNFSYSIDIPQ